ncbi:MAG: biotin transporter BioY [Planctomycetota bacterium]
MLTNVTVADLWRPCQRTRALFYDIALIIGASLLIALSAQVAIPLWPVPVTGQTFAVLMIAALVLAYLAEGAAGLPVFAMGGAMKGLTAGYLVGFVPAAYVVGLLAEKGWDRRVSTTILAMALGNIIIYTFGLLWLCCLPGIHSVFRQGLYPFIIGDLLKIALAAALLPSGWKLLKILDPKQNNTGRQS